MYPRRLCFAAGGDVSVSVFVYLCKYSLICVCVRVCVRV